MPDDEILATLEDFVASQMRATDFDGEQLEQVVEQMLARAVEADPPTATNLFVRVAGEPVRLDND